MFKDGRTETIRPCTKEVIEVAKMMETVSEINFQQPCALFVLTLILLNILAGFGEH